MKKAFIDAHPEILNWAASPETDMRDHVKNSGGSVYIFEELRPIHAPSLMRKLCMPLLTPIIYEGGRFRLFVAPKVVTHHVEDLPEGMHTKKALANTLAKSLTNISKGEPFFTDAPYYELTWFEKNIQNIARYFPQSTWFKRKG